MKKHFGLITAFLTLTGIQVMAGDGGMSTGGGASVVCRDAQRRIVSAEFYDLYEGKIRYGMEIPQNGNDAQVIIKRAISNFYLNTFMEVKVAETTADILRRFQFLPPGVILRVGSDIGNEVGIVIPDGCDLEAVGFYEADGSLKVAQPIYKALSPASRAAFILHEVLYKLARETSGIKTSTLPRRLNAAAFSTNVSPRIISDAANQLFYQRLPWDTNTGNRDRSNQFFAIVEGKEDGILRFNIAPDRNQTYFFSAHCLDLSGHKLTDADFKGNGPTTLNLKDPSCQNVELILSAGVNDPNYNGGKPIGLNFELGTQSLGFFLGSNVQVGGWWQIIRLARRTDIPTLPVL